MQGRKGKAYKVAQGCKGARVRGYKGASVAMFNEYKEVNDESDVAKM